MPYQRLQWKDEQPYSELYGDVYFSTSGGADESRHVFIDGNQLPARFSRLGENRQNFTVCETGFGTGLNFLLTVQQFLRNTEADITLDYVSVEKHLLHPDDLRTIYASQPDIVPLCNELLNNYPLPLDGMHRCLLFDGRVRLGIIVDDVVTGLDDLCMCVDAWFLDGFSPSKNEAMWSQQVFDLMAKYSREHTTFATYTVAGSVKRGLQRSGYTIKKQTGYGAKREMLCGTFTAQPEVSQSAPWYALPDTSAKQKTAIIVGAGVAGLSTAWQMVQRGWKIRLVDKHAQVAAGASGNAAAIIMPRLSLDDAIDNEFYKQAFCFARQQYAVLQQTSKQPFWFATGVLNGIDKARAEQLVHRHAISGLLEPVERGDLSCELTWLNCAYAGWLRPQVLCQYLYALCADALQFYQAEVASLSNEQGKNSVYDKSGSLICCADSIVFANAHTVSDIEQFDYLPVHASRGQVTTISSELLQRDIPAPLSATAYCTPVYGGEICVGASYSAVTDMELSADEQQSSIEKIQRLLPGLVSKPLPLRGRVANRAISDDRVALVGAAPDKAYFAEQYGDLHHGRPAKNYRPASHLRGVYLNVGHGSRGFSSSFLAAEILASMMDGSAMPVTKSVLDYLNPARFLVRQLKRNPPQTG